MTEKRFFRALFKTMLFFAFLHLILLFVLFTLSFKLSYLNVFSIVGLDEFFPNINEGAVSFIVSLGIMLLVYFVFYKKTKN